MDLIEEIIEVLQERTNFNKDMLMMVSYAIVVAEIYHEAPLKDAKVQRSYEATIDNINLLYDRIQSKFGIEIIPTEEDPYSSDEEMIRSIAKEKKIKVYTGDSDHPFYNHDTNIKFRAVHDIFTHYGPHKNSVDAAGNVKFKGSDFSYPGELDAYHTHKRYSPKECWPAYYSEVVGQVSFQAVTGNFGKQKMVWFPDQVDVANIGKLKGPALERQKELFVALSAGSEIKSSIPGVAASKVMSAAPFKGKGGSF